MREGAGRVTTAGNGEWKSLYSSRRGASWETDRAKQVGKEKAEALRGR